MRALSNHRAWAATLVLAAAIGTISYLGTTPATASTCTLIATPVQRITDSTYHITLKATIYAYGCSLQNSGQAKIQNYHGTGSVCQPIYRPVTTIRYAPSYNILNWGPAGQVTDCDGNPIPLNAPNGGGSW